MIRPAQDGQTPGPNLTPGPIRPPQGIKDWSETGREMLIGWAIGVLGAAAVLAVVVLTVALVSVTWHR